MILSLIILHLGFTFTCTSAFQEVYSLLQCIFSNNYLFLSSACPCEYLLGNIIFRDISGFPCSSINFLCFFFFCRFPNNIKYCFYSWLSFRRHLILFGYIFSFREERAKSHESVVYTGGQWRPKLTVGRYDGQNLRAHQSKGPPVKSNNKSI